MTTTRDAVKDTLDFIADENPKAIIYDGLDDAITGYAFPTHDAEHSVLAYSHTGILQILVERDGMSYADAQEYFDYNILGLILGEHQPLIIFDSRGP
jgi:hypothetical protein